jgi:hypothetical protein
MILLSPLLAVCVPPLFLMACCLWLWQRIYRRFAPPLEWHQWFAWRPVRHYNEVDWLWLEQVERSWRGFGVGCIYRDHPTERPGK